MEQRSVKTVGQRQERWYSVEGHTARFFRLGEWLNDGTVLGLSCYDGQPVLVEEGAQLVEVQYDVWENRLYLVLKSAGHHIPIRRGA